jgi:hypothetical protein
MNMSPKGPSNPRVTVYFVLTREGALRRAAQQMWGLQLSGRTSHCSLLKTVSHRSLLSEAYTRDVTCFGCFDFSSFPAVFTIQPLPPLPPYVRSSRAAPYKVSSTSPARALTAVFLSVSEGVDLSIRFGL